MKIFIVDAFTDVLFKGNPAGVCLLENELSVEFMQSIATELNLSETAFIRPNVDDETVYSIRYFTPTVEISFCGHATLASAKIILHHLGKLNVTFATFNNLKVAAFSCSGYIRMNFPQYDAADCKASEALYAAFGITKPIATKFCPEFEMLIIELADNGVLDKINPDFSKALSITDELKEVILTVKSADSNFDFYSRCFCPWIGINEDPVTGAAHSVLAKYWSQVLGKTEMVAYQASKRGGYMRLKILNNDEVEVASNAVIVFEGILKL